MRVHIPAGLWSRAISLAGPDIGIGLAVSVGGPDLADLTWRSSLAESFGGVVWRSRLAESFGGVVWRSRLAESGEWINELRFNSRAVPRWGAMRRIAWRSLVGAPCLAE
jgi:hypothetical protein